MFVCKLVQRVKGGWGRIAKKIPRSVCQLLHLCRACRKDCERFEAPAERDLCVRIAASADKGLPVVEVGTGA